MALFSALQEFITKNGQPVEGASVLVKLAGSATAATLYATRDGGTKSNPFLTRADGNALCYVSPGRYDMTVTFNAEQVTFNDVEVGPVSQVGSFTDGVTLTDPDQWVRDSDGALWEYTGSTANFPLQVAPGSAPDNNFRVVVPNGGRQVGSVDSLRNTKARFNGEAIQLVSYHAGANKGGGVFVWDAASTAADDDGVTIAVTGVATGRWVRQLDGFVTPEMFGARYNLTDNDTAVIRNCHIFANSTFMPVCYSGGSISIDSNAEIPLKTDTDFNGVLLNIVGGVEADPAFSSFNTLYVVTDDDCPVVEVSGSVLADNLRRGSLFPTLGMFDGHGYAELECGYQVPNRAKTGTMNYIQSFKVNRRGRASFPLSADLSAFAGDIIVRYRRTSKRKLTISNICLVEGAWNNQQIFEINRCNVKISGFSMLFNEAGNFENICQIITIKQASDIVIDDFVTSGRPSGGVASYCLAINGGADIYINNMNALTGWGATGTNNVNGIYFNNCTLNRIDAHSSGHNMFAANCNLHESGMVYGWGGGILSVKNTNLNRCSAISSRGDYGGTFFGDIVVSDIETCDNATSTLYVVNLVTNPLGADSDVFAPENIYISNVKRTGKASGGNAELIAIGIKVRSPTDVVFSPVNVTIDNISSIRSWRLGSRMDWLNFEANPIATSPAFRLSGSRGAVAATSSSGLLDYDSIRTPSAPVTPRVFVSDCDNVHVRMRTNGGEISVDNSTINAVATDLLTTVAPLVSINNSKILTPASGYTNAPIGGRRTGNSNFTSIRNCDIGTANFDLSDMSLAIGNTVRKGSTTPLLPAGVTVDQIFTGWRAMGAFQ